MVKVWDEYRAERSHLRIGIWFPKLKKQRKISRLDNELRSLNFVKVDRNLPGHRER